MTVDRGAPVVVRRAGPRDQVGFMALRAAWRQSLVTDAFTTEFTGWFDREGKHRWWWLAEDRERRAVGMVNLQVFERMPTPGAATGRWGYLANLFVAPAVRGRGTGTALVMAVLRAASEEGLVRVVLSPSERSVPLYERAGFRAADMLLVWQPAT